MKKNEMQIEFDAKSINEGFARVAAAAFISQLNPTLDELADVKTAVSEAVTNAIIHGYGKNDGKVFLSCILEGNQAQIIVEDYGVGIKDLKRATEPFYTSKPELERSGMGFAFMEAFTDDMKVESVFGKGTKVTLIKKIGQEEKKDGFGDSSH